jgi:hypothetical protein
MKILSVPLYDVIIYKLWKVFKNNIKKEIEMPFELYDEIIDA